MCRLAAYLGAPVPLGRFLFDPPHGLPKQAWAPQELRYARLNADGFGIGWYGDDARPITYINPAPIWTDPNLPHLGRALRSPLWIGSVRSATDGNPVSHANTQPFGDSTLLFDHNGFIEDFHAGLRARLCAELRPAFLADIRGNTESEYLFALLRQILADDATLPLERALARLAARVDAWNDGVALLNILVSDGERICALRHAVADPCPSLYYSTDDELFPDGQLIASERLTESDYWQVVPEHRILVLDRDQPPELVEL